MTAVDKYLAGVKARAEKATAGPWRLVNEIDPNPIFLKTWGPNYKTVFYIQAGYGFGEGGNSETQSSLTNITPPHITHLSRGDAAFIAHARTDVERLVAMVEALQAKLDLCQRITLDLKYGNNPDWVRLNVSLSVADGYEQLDRLARGGK